MQRAIGHCRGAKKFEVRVFCIILILHMDDAGMSHDSNAGIEGALEKGAARSLNVMMP